MAEEDRPLLFNVEPPVFNSVPALVSIQSFSSIEKFWLISVPPESVVSVPQLFNVVLLPLVSVPVEVILIVPYLLINGSGVSWFYIPLVSTVIVCPDGFGFG